MSELSAYLLNPSNWLVILSTVTSLTLLYNRIRVAIIEKRTKELGEIAKEASSAAAKELISNAAKRELVLTTLRAAVPSRFKPYFTEETLIFIAESAYQLTVKPQLQSNTSEN